MCEKNWDEETWRLFEGLSQNKSDTENNDKSDQTKRMANIAIQWQVM
jgi:hypothetical protein